MITREELDKLGLSPDAMKIVDPRTGKEGYRVGLEVFHQLHCLDLLRKYSYREHYTSWGDVADDPDKLRLHMGK